MAQIGVHDHQDVAGGRTGSRYYGFGHASVAIAGNESYGVFFLPFKDVFARAVGGTVVYYQYFKVV